VRIYTRVFSALMGLAVAAGVFLPAMTDDQPVNTSGDLPSEEVAGVALQDTGNVLSLFDGIAGPVAGLLIFFCGALAFFLSLLGAHRLCLAPSVVAAGLTVIARRVATGRLDGLFWLPPQFLPPFGQTGRPLETAWIWLLAASAGLALTALIEIVEGRRPMGRKA
jgi:hypothetical protein